MQDSGLEEFSVELLIISYPLSSKHLEEQKLGSFYEKGFSVVADLHLEM